MDALKTKAFSLLAKRPYFSKELRKKLLDKGFSKDRVQSLLDLLKKQGLLNDEELAARFIERQKAKGYGAKLIAHKLRERAGEALSFEIFDSNEDALNLIKKKYQKDLPHKKNKVIAALLRRGYSYELIKTILEDISSK